MAIVTRNLYGNIIVKDRAVLEVATNAALECVGVASSMVSFINIEDNKIDLNLRVKLKYGVNLIAVCETLRTQVKYSVEKVTSGSVRTINIIVDQIK